MSIDRETTISGNMPAFPCEAQGDRSVPPEHDYLQTGIHAAKFPGMTLRDWMASQALAAIPHIGCGADLDIYDLARAAYQLADAMLEARKS